MEIENDFLAAKKALRQLINFKANLLLSMNLFKEKFPNEEDSFGNELLCLVSERREIIKRILACYIFKPFAYKSKIDSLVKKSSEFEDNFNFLLSTRGLKIATLGLKQEQESL